MASSREIRAAGGCSRCDWGVGEGGLCCAGVETVAASRTKIDTKTLRNWKLLTREAHDRETWKARTGIGDQAGRTA